MKTYLLKREQFVAADIATVWNFFSNPNNLSVITPAKMKFKVLTKNLATKIHPGMLIKYTVSPLFNIRLNWVTEIKDVIENEIFVDEQRKGPYLFWKHTHVFVADGNGTRMKDVVEYALPFSYVGVMMHTLLVRKKLNEIFEFQSKVISEIFPTRK